MAKGFEQRAAKAVLAMRGKGKTAINDDIAKSARLILAGTHSPTDVDAVVRAVGWTRSGASSVKTANRAFSAVQQTFVKYSREADILASSQAPATAKIRIAAELSRDLEGLLKTKAIKSIAKSVSEFLGRSPEAGASFLRMATRGLRLGGAIGLAIAGGLAVAESYFTARKETSRAELDTYKTQKELKINESLFRQQKEIIDVAQKDQAAAFEHTLNAYGLSSSVSKAAEARKSALMKTLAQGREVLQQNKGDVILSVYASERQKRVEDLTEREKAEAFDRATLDEYDPDKYIHGANVSKQIDRERPAKEFLNAMPFARFFTNTETDTYGRRRELSEEYVKQLIEKTLQRTKDREELFERTRSKESGAAVWKRNEQQKEQAIKFAAMQGRRRAWSND